RGARVQNHLFPAEEQSTKALQVCAGIRDLAGENIIGDHLYVSTAARHGDWSAQLTVPSIRQNCAQHTGTRLACKTLCSIHWVHGPNRGPNFGRVGRFFAAEFSEV